MSQTDILTERLDFMKMDTATEDAIRRVKPTIMGRLPGALDSFYQQVQAFPQTRAFFPNQTLLSSAKSRQLGHWDVIASGRFDQSYLRAVTVVGQTHARIGLEPRWYIGGYALVLEALLGAVLEARWPKGGFGSKKSDVKAVAAELGAVAKATLLDMDLAISVYLEASETARKVTEEKAAATSQAVMRCVGEALAALANGDLTHRIGADMPDEYASLREHFNNAIGQLSDALSHVLSSADQLASGADDIAQASDDLSRRTEQQAASLEETAAALDEITATVKQTAQGADQANGAASDAKDVARKSGEVVSRAVAAMSEIEASSTKISQIIGVIDEIAFQTNLLALNAGVEAARAGEAGRGFAVVASEVRALAQRSAEAAKEIKSLISASSRQVGEGVGLVGETGEALRAIIDKVTEVDGLVSTIAASAQEQATGLSQVNTAINQMDRVVQQNAAMVEQSTAAAHALKAETAGLAQTAARFQVRSGSARTGADDGAGRPALRAV